MNITTADACLGDLHADIVRIFKSGYRAILKDDISDGTEDKRRIRFLIVQFSGDQLGDIRIHTVMLA